MEILGEDRREGISRRIVPRVNLFLLFLVSLILLLSSLYSAEASVFKKARESILDVASPLLSVLSVPVEVVNNLFGRAGDYLHVMDENKALRQENAELRQWMEEALALRQLLSSYEQLQSYQPSPDVIPIDAYVIGDSNDVFARSMVLNAGRNENVRTGYAVVNEAGLVGRIIEAGKNASRVLLLTDIQSRIPVYVEGEGIDGILVGQTRTRPLIRFTNKVTTRPVRSGARVLTSGAGGIIPRGLPVGVVFGMKEDEIEITLNADYSQTRLVRVLEYTFPKDTQSDANDLGETDVNTIGLNENDRGTL